MGIYNALVALLGLAGLLMIAGGGWGISERLKRPGGRPNDPNDMEFEIEFEVSRAICDAKHPIEHSIGLKKNSSKSPPTCSTKGL